MKLRLAIAVLALAILVSTFSAPVPSAAAGPGSLSLGRTSTFGVPGVSVPGTPDQYNKVMVRRFGSPSAANVLVLVPGTLGGAGDFAIVGPYLASHVPNLQVWAEMRREGALEDNSMLLKGLDQKATIQQVFDYYVGWLADPKITPHYQMLQASQYGFADQWGLGVAMGDLHNVIQLARQGGKRHVILGGHSLGGAEASIYPVWDFNGRPGYKDIAGVIGIDGDAGLSSGFGQTPITTAADANAALTKLAAGSPWLDLLGLGLPWIAGAFAETGALSALQAPDSPSVGQSFALLPAAFKPTVPATNSALFGYAFDAATSPAALSLIHIHSGHLATSGTPRKWADNGPTPIKNLAFAFAQEPLGAVDWYYPQRLSIDTEVASGLTPTPAAGVLGLKLSHTAQVNVPLYVIETSLGGKNNAVAKAAAWYKAHSKIPSVTVVNRTSTYGHLDPLLAAPSRNAFLQTVVPWIEKLHGYHK